MGIGKRKLKKAVFQDKSYTWNGERWFESSTFLTPCRATQRELNRLLRAELAAEDVLETNPYELVHLASLARDALQYDRAEELCHRAIRLNPESMAPYSVLSSVLRKRGDAQHAVAITESYKRCNDPVLLTTRAAARPGRSPFRRYAYRQP